MIDLWLALQVAARDPLVVASGVFILGGLATHFLFKQRALARALVRLVFLILLTFAFVHAGIAPYRPLQPAGTSLRDVVHGILQIAWWLWAAWFLVGFLRVFVIGERRPHEGKLLQDLLAGLIYLGAVFAVIAFVFDLPIGGLLATSGVVAIILGLALQSTLSDVFSGIVLNFTRPYRPGDWINLEGGTDGRVIEMNWRATHVLTARRDLAIVPNSIIAKSKIVNVSSPAGAHGVTMRIQFDGTTLPSTDIEILEHAILNCRMIVTNPAPVITVKSLSAACTEFEITFFVEGLEFSVKVRNQLFDFIFRHLAMAGINLASDAQPSDGQLEAAARKRTEAERLVDLVAIFGGLTTDERTAIAAKLKPTSYDRSETVVEPGTVLHSLFIVGAGVLSLVRGEEEGEIELARLGPGDHFGEIGMLTGARSTTKTTALMPTTVFELAKADLSPILKARPRVAQELSRALARRQAGLRLIASDELEDSVPTNSLTAWFSGRMQRLFRLVKAK